MICRRAGHGGWDPAGDPAGSPAAYAGASNATSVTGGEVGGG